AIQGTREVMVPVTFSVLTTLAAFAPLLFVPGVMGKIFRLIPIVAIAVLSFSLVESFFVLPAHLAHEGGARKRSPARRALTALLYALFIPQLSRLLVRPVDFTQRRVSDWVERFTARRFRALLETVLHYRRLVLAFSLTSLMIAGSAVASGVIPFSF